MLSSFRGSLIGTLCGGARFDQQTFDPNPDLSITVGRQPWQELLVDSRALCRVSPVLRKRLADTYILRGIRYSSRSSAAQHGRSRPCAMIRENFPDDDPAAFCTLMDIIHSRYEISNPVPAPDVEIMFEIVRLAYKYEMVRVLRPYSAAWLADLRIRARISVADIDPGLLKLILFVAWVLGEDKLFQVAAERLAELWLIDEEGELIENDGGMRLKDYNYLQELDILGKLAPGNRHVRSMAILT